MNPCRAGLAAMLLLALPACARQPEIRTDDPAHLVFDLADALRPAARAWHKETMSRDESATLGHPSSAEISSQAIQFMRLISHARALLAPYLPPETRGVPVPADLSAEFRRIATALGTADREALVVETLARTPVSARFRLVIAASGSDPQAWLLTLAESGGVWRFTSAPRRG